MSDCDNYRNVTYIAANFFFFDLHETLDAQLIGV